MENAGIKIQKRPSGSSESPYRVFSVRVRTTTLKSLDDLSKKCNRSRNELINIMLDYGVENCKIIE